MPTPKKRPQNRTGAASGAANDPRFLRVSEGEASGRDFPIPKPDPSWKPKARSWYNSLALSGQAEFWEPSDWATAVAAADMYDLFLKTHNASMASQFVKLSERLAVTVTDRKRGRIELAEPEPEDVDEEEADKAVLGWHGRLYVVD